MNLGVPARAVAPEGSKEGSRQVGDQSGQLWQGVLAGGRKQDQLLEPFRVGRSKLDADRPSEGMPCQHETLRQLQHVGDLDQVGDQLGHRVGAVRRVAQPMPAQIGGDHAVAAGEVVKLIVPGLGHTGVAMHEDNGPFHALRLQVDDTELGLRVAGNGDCHPVQVEIQLDRSPLEPARLVFHGAPIHSSELVFYRGSPEC